MLDVHAPHSRIEGFKDFCLHLLTITIGLLIALGLEGCVEWQYHRHLVNEANTGLRSEIAQNIKTLDSMRQPIKDQEKQLEDDLATLTALQAHPDAQGQSLGFGFVMHSFDDTAWRTAQTTGAFAYMPYADASTYADIYSAQEQFVQTEKEIVDEVLIATAIPTSQPQNWRPTQAQIDELRHRAGILRIRLSYLNQMLDVLEQAYHRV
jgi:hypothetical protein